MQEIVGGLGSKPSAEAVVLLWTLQLRMPGNWAEEQDSVARGWGSRPCQEEGGEAAL